MKIAIGKSRKSTKWKTINSTWEELCNKLSQTTRTHETVKEYKAMSKSEQAVIKDVGGFVAGTLKDGHRRRENVISRSLITLDADFASESMLANTLMLCDYEFCVYSTHKHQPKQPRLRFVFPLTREVTPEEYEPLSRLVASSLGIDYFDVSTYEPCRLMYWPSTPRDGEFIYEHQEGEYINPDEWLAKYKDWRDASEWPIATTEMSVRVKQAKQQGDPTTKPGIVGLFCRTYDVHTAIDAYLSDKYTLCDEQHGGYTRYTYTEGSTFGGVVIYQDGQFAYSHHATDPAGGQLCNAFDLVRLHLYHDLDANCGEDTAINKRPSYEAMGKLVNSDNAVKAQKVLELQDEITADFGIAPDKPQENLIYEAETDGDTESEVDWTSKLTFNIKTGEIESTAANVLLILENDPIFKDCLVYNQFTSRKTLTRDVQWRELEVGDRSSDSIWRDRDESFVRIYLEKVYHIVGKDKVKDAINHLLNRHSVHPVRDYLNSIAPKWDGVERAERVLIDYMGAEDSEYVRAVTKTWLTAAVARIYVPGIKFDNVLMLIGPQGIGKSTLGRKLGQNWFSDTFTTIHGKEGLEQLRGKWIIEIGELSATRKSEVQAVKQFLAKEVDSYRAAYAENFEDYPRQCVFYGTTNDVDVLRDSTGNRRFWTVYVTGNTRKMFDGLTQDVVDQIWAEVVQYWRSGTAQLYLPKHLSDVLEEEQEAFTEDDPMLGTLQNYVDKPIPRDWDEWDIYRRREYYNGSDFGLRNYNPEDLMERESFCAMGYLYETGQVPIGATINKGAARAIIANLNSLKDWYKCKTRKVVSCYGQQTVIVKKDTETWNKYSNGIGAKAFFTKKGN